MKKRENTRDEKRYKAGFMLSMHPFNEHEMSDLSSTDIIVNNQVSNQLQNEFMSSPFIYIS